jgi:hypothetical protein
MYELLQRKCLYYWLRERKKEKKEKRGGESK